MKKFLATFLIFAIFNPVSLAQTEENCTVKSHNFVLGYNIVQCGDKYGVTTKDGAVILQANYDYIREYSIQRVNNRNYKNTIISILQDNKYGLADLNGEILFEPEFDKIETINKHYRYIKVKKDNKYGIIDSRGNVKIYIEYDEIGIDNTKFQKNDIKNKYLIANGLIPVRKDKTWALFDKNGNQLTDFEYDSFGYIASSNKDAINLLVIPDYDVIVACKNKKYTLINSSGKTIFAALVDDIYMTISSGQKHYYMNFNDRTEDVETV